MLSERAGALEGRWTRQGWQGCECSLQRGRVAGAAACVSLHCCLLLPAAHASPRCSIRCSRLRCARGRHRCRFGRALAGWLTPLELARVVRLQPVVHLLQEAGRPLVYDAHPVAAYLGHLAQLRAGGPWGRGRSRRLMRPPSG